MIGLKGMAIGGAVSLGIIIVLGWVALEAHATIGKKEAEIESLQQNVQKWKAAHDEQVAERKRIERLYEAGVQTKRESEAKAKANRQAREELAQTDAQVADYLRTPVPGPLLERMRQLPASIAARGGEAGPTGTVPPVPSPTDDRGQPD